jgi:tetratricopeptide (TPR) repeat protein
MALIQKTAFISYRRTNFYIALSIHQFLEKHGYDVFWDYTGLTSGDFGAAILEQIKARAHFLVILTPSALERCGEPGDWLRFEIETALDSQRNIVPLLLDGFDFETPAISRQLSGKLAVLKRYNYLRISPDYFIEAMDRLRLRFLDVKVEAILHPLSAESERVAAKEMVEVSKWPILEGEALEIQLTAQRLFERGVSAADLDEKVKLFSNAIMRSPQFTDAFLARADAFERQLERKQALMDYDAAIRLQSDSASAFFKRGNTRFDECNFSGALQDYTDAIRLEPRYAYAYLNRGVARFEMKDFVGAERDYCEALLLKPNWGLAYMNRSLVRAAVGDLVGASEDRRKAMRLGEDPNSEAIYG